MVSRPANCQTRVILTMIAAMCIACQSDSHAADPAAHTPSMVSVESNTPLLFAQSDATTSQPASLKDDPRYRRWQFTITWGLVIVIAFVTAAAAIVVFSRGFRRWIGRERKTPTASEDVWAMHKAPDDAPDIHDDSTSNN